MGLVLLEDAIEPFYKRCKNLDFCTLIKDARDCLGLKRYKASEFLGIFPARLQNLETGYFRVMPEELELIAFSQLYGLDFDVLKQKAEEHVEKHKLAKKTRVYFDE